jgi:hypothetical protein
LIHYRLDAHLPPLNLIEYVSQANAGSAEVPRRPVDLVLAKLGPDAVLVASGERGWAVIERRRAAGGAYEYRYQVVESYGFEPDGSFAWLPRPAPTTDPLRLSATVPGEFLARFHDEATWLDVTVRTDYPDGLVAISRHMLWDDTIRPREDEYAPDLVVTAAPGWQFGEENEPGTSHGHPLADTMRNTWLVAGPNVRRGAVVERPCRAVDVLPTILEMAGVAFRPDEMDGHALRLIYAGAGPGEDRYPVDLVHRAATTAAGRAAVEAQVFPVYWSDVDLKAWAPIRYEPRPEYPLDWAPVHRFDNPWDLHNLVHNVTTLSDIEFTRVADDAIHAFAGDRAGVTDGFNRLDERIDARRNTDTAGRWLAEGNHALQLRHIAFGDFGYTSSGNWKRGNLLIDWVQYRYEELDQGLARPLQLPTVVGAPVANRGIDAAQGMLEGGRQFLERTILWLVSDQVVNSIENGIGSLRNWGKATPAEVVVDH